MDNLSVRERLDQIDSELKFHKLAIKHGNDELDYQWHTKTVYELLRLKQLYRKSGNA